MIVDFFYNEVHVICGRIVIWIVQSVWIHKMSVCSSELQGFLIHTVTEALDIPTHILCQIQGIIIVGF